MASSIASIADLTVTEELDLRLGRMDDPSAKARLRIIDEFMGADHARVIAQAMYAARSAFGQVGANESSYDRASQGVLLMSALRCLIEARRMRPVAPTVRKSPPAA